VAYAEISEGEAKFRHNRVTSQINFRRSTEGTIILGGSGSMPPGKLCKITPKITHFFPLLKQVLDNTFLHFLFLGSEGVAMAQQARSQVLKFGGAKYIFRGALVLFLSYF